MVGPSQPVVKLRLHSAGEASPLHPTALKNARWGPRPLTALLLPQILPIFSVVAPLRRGPHGADCAVGWNVGAPRRPRCDAGLSPRAANAGKCQDAPNPTPALPGLVR